MRVDFETVAEAQELARRRLPPLLYRSLLHGSGLSQTAEANARAFQDVEFVPRGGVGVMDRKLSTSLLGVELSLPVLTAPTGNNKYVHSGGEVAVARAATEAGTVSVVSMNSSNGIEEVTSGVEEPRRLWKQLYLDRRTSAEHSRSFVEETIHRAADAGYGALVLTVDLPVSPAGSPRWLGRSSKPIGLNSHTALTLGPQLLSRPRWAVDFLRHRPDLSSLVRASKPPTRAYSATWEDFDWIRKLWQGPIIAKGVLAAVDARRAIDCGSAAVVVSNHGGKGLDGVMPTLRALPAVVEEVNGAVPVLMDGGISRGTDVAKAIALGATAVLVGRSYLWGLAVGGQAGVTQVLAVLRRELDVALGLLGCPSVLELDRSFVRHHGW